MSTDFLHKRYFTSLKFVSNNKAIRKSLSNIANASQIESFENEIRYYKELPIHFSHLFPNLYDYKVDGINSFIELEYIDGLNATNLITHDKSYSEFFSQFCFQLTDALNVFRIFSPSTKTVLTEAFYIDKLNSRLNEAKDFWQNNDNPEYQEILDIFENPFFIDSEPCESIDTLHTELIEEIEMQAKLNEFIPNYMHGDLVLSNILYQIDENRLFMVDPRGSFGKDYSNVGDNYYDRIKLIQCLYGYYDFIISDNFELIKYNRNYHLILNKTSLHDKKISLAKSIVLGKVSDLEFTLVVSLFLSMIPYHRENTRRQLAFLVIASRMFQNVKRNIQMNRNRKGKNR